MLVIIIAASIVMRGASAVRKGGGDLQGYIEVGELVVSGSDPYATEWMWTNMWPPVFSVLSVPMALGARLSLPVTAATWGLLMGACLYGCLWLSIWLVYRRPLTIKYKRDTISITSAAALGPMILTWRFALQNVRWLQVNILILFLALAGCYLIARHRPKSGGAMVGISAGLKVMPVLFVPYFAFKRWWRAAAGAIAAGALVTLAPILAFGPSGWWAHTMTFIERSRTVPIPVDWGTHSLFAMVDRYVGHQLLANPHILDSELQLKASGHPLVMPITIALWLLVTLLFVLVSRRSRRDPASREATVEFAMVFMIIPLVSPSIAWQTYFIFMLLGHAVLWRAATDPVRSDIDPEVSDRGVIAGGPPEALLEKRERRTIRLLLAASFVLGTIASASVVGSAMARRLQWLSILTVSAMAALAALYYLRWVMGRRAPESAGYQSFSTTGSR